MNDPTALMEPRLNYLDCPEPAGGHHRMAWWQWGDPQAPRALVCVHGLTRQGRDFDVLAQSAVERARSQGQSIRVICPDIVGRGRSDWLADPAAYRYRTYAADMLALLARLRRDAPPQAMDWVGTSMGGIIGILLAARDAEAAAPLMRHLVLNDVGPVIEWRALARIGDYLGHQMDFPTFEAGAAYLRAQSLGFGPCAPAAWLTLSRPQLRELPDGRWGMRYDPAIAAGWRSLTPELLSQGEALLWQAYDHIAAKTLLLHGADSDLLSAESARRMQARGPRPRMVEFAGVGHAPMLIADDQRRAVLDFLFPAA